MAAAPRALLWLLALPGLTTGQDLLRAGEEGQFLVPGYSDASVLWVPQDHERGKRLPLVIFLHGAGGRPTTWPWRSATSGKGCFVLGLCYGGLPGAGQSGIAADRKSSLAMVEFLRKAIATVDEGWGIDRKRVILTGLSMGGWGVNFYGLCKEAKDLYCAYAILAAGPTTRGELVDFAVAKDRPVLLLNGEKDPNLAAANQGRPALEQAGALVTQEILPGQGHVPSLESMRPPLAKWLDAVLAREDTSAAAIAWQDLPVPDLPAGTRQIGPWLLASEALRGGDKPVLVLFRSLEQGTRGPTPAARASAAADEAAFSWPGACGVPVAARHLRCVRVDVTRTSTKTNPLVNQTNAPLVVLLTKDGSTATIVRKERLRDEPLLAEIRKLLTVEEIDDVDKRIATSKPILEELRAIRTRIAKETAALERLRGRRSTKEDALRRQEQILKELAAEEEKRLGELRRIASAER